MASPLALKDVEQGTSPLKKSCDICNEKKEKNNSIYRTEKGNFYNIFQVYMERTKCWDKKTQ